MQGNESNLPARRISQITRPLARFLKIEVAAAALLLGSTVIAVVLTNSNWSEPFLRFWQIPLGFHIGSLAISHPLQKWINDALMTLFFFVVALELKRELVLGELRNLRLAMLPFAGAIGGMLFPALIYLVMMRGQPEVRGWGMVMATDTAFVIGCLAFLGSRVPISLRIFLLSLAIFDDVGAILVVAIGYGASLNWTAMSLGLAGVAAIIGAAWIGMRSVPVYSLIGGLIWLCFDASGIHPTIVGVILGLLTPTHGWVSDKLLRSIFGLILSYPKGEHWSGDKVDRYDLGKAGTAAREALSPVERLEMRLHPWVGFAVMPIFALCNAGVVVDGNSLGQSSSLAIVVALALGKPIGVFSMSWLAVRFGMAKLFTNLTWPLIAGGGMLTGIGFTMSLFIATLALPPSSLAAAKIGILTASTLSAIAGISTLACLTRFQSKKKPRNGN